MLRPVAFPFVALLSVAAAACSPAPHANADPSHPDWLVGSFHGPGSLGDYSNELELHADGTTLATDEIWGSDGITDYYTASTWTFDGQTLTLGNSLTTFAAGCHLLELADRDYPVESKTYWIAGSGAIDGCPQSEPALSDAERALVHTWSGDDLLLFFDESRSVRWNLGQTTTYYRWAVDADGTTFHLTAPDGTEKLSATLTLTGDKLEICAGSQCSTLTRLKD